MRCEQFHKIGASVDPEGRCKHLDIYPSPIVLVHKIATNDMGWLESRLHRRFARQRIRREWFRLSDEDLSFLLALERQDREDNEEDDTIGPFQHSLRIPQELLDALDEYAAENRRSRNTTILLIIERVLKEEGRWPRRK